MIGWKKADEKQASLLCDMETGCLYRHLLLLLLLLLLFVFLFAFFLVYVVCVNWMHVHTNAMKNICST